MYELYKDNRIASSNPRKLTPKDIAEFVNYRQSDALNAMLAFKNAAGKGSAGGRI